MHTSSKGLALIESFEGYVGRPYNDVSGYATVGFGHLLGYRHYTTADVARFSNWTRSDFEHLLATDVEGFERAVANSIHVSLTQGQFDALVSFVYNCGPGAITHIAQLLNGGHANQVPAVMRQYVKSAGRVVPALVTRRNIEIALFVSGGDHTQVRHDPYASMTTAERRWCSEYDRLKASNSNLRRRRVLRRYMTKQRKRIYSAGQASGWSKAHRRERYHALLARTT